MSVAEPEDPQTTPTEAALVLADGTIFEGEAIGWWDPVTWCPPPGRWCSTPRSSAIRKC